MVSPAGRSGSSVSLAYPQAIGTVRFVSTLMNELVQHIYA